MAQLTEGIPIGEGDGPHQFNSRKTKVITNDFIQRLGIKFYHKKENFITLDNRAVDYTKHVLSGGAERVDRTRLSNF